MISQTTLASITCPAGQCKDNGGGGKLGQRPWLGACPGQGPGGMDQPRNWWPKPGPSLGTCGPNGPCDSGGLSGPSSPKPGPMAMAPESISTPKRSGDSRRRCSGLREGDAPTLDEARVPPKCGEGDGCRCRNKGPAMSPVPREEEAASPGQVQLYHRCTGSDTLQDGDLGDGLDGACVAVAIKIAGGQDLAVLLGIAESIFGIAAATLATVDVMHSR
mmetsp:Transcript_25963/g.54898  ORF Transcript_25963/g.54898 Transcript_25963/m.54898 type:complete len:218 (-) Transcript_25963:67-720(-)